jgi:hypothetical protein
MTWYVLFFLVLLKIPVVWLAYVIWWAVKKQPELPPGDGRDGGGGPGTSGPDAPVPASWWRPGGRPGRRSVRRGAPRAVPSRRPASALSRAETKDTTTP